MVSDSEFGLLVGCISVQGYSERSMYINIFKNHKTPHKQTQQQKHTKKHTQQTNKYNENK